MIAYIEMYLCIIPLFALNAARVGQGASAEDTRGRQGQVAGLSGFEPPTYNLEGCCSIQLSYSPVPSLLYRNIATDASRVLPPVHGQRAPSDPCVQYGTIEAYSVLAQRSAE